MFRISSSALPTAVQNNLNRTTALVSQSIMRLSSGLRINRAGDDPAGLATSAALNSVITSLQQANRNTGMAISFTQTAEGGASSISDILVRLKELAIQAADSTTSTSSRSAIQLEADQLIQEIDRIASSTTFNGTCLTATNTNVTFYVGDGLGGINDQIGLQLSNLGSSAIVAGLTSAQIAVVGTATTALASVELGITSVTLVRSRFGAVENRLSRTSVDISARIALLQEADSAIRDADIAQEATSLIRAHILSQAGTFALAQTNLLAQNVMPLIGLAR
ncbi:flagellin FliC [Candidatus Poribacteria bacterium]|nr:flagellin FliC [Candidatus Poribacteria bacterium]